MKLPKILLITGLILVFAGAGCWVYYSSSISGVIYNPFSSLSQDQARDLYRQSLKALQAQKYDVAAKGFRQLEDAYPGLKEVICLHEVEAFQHVPDERTVQLAMKHGIDLGGDNPFYSQFLYELGLSNFRAKEYEQAKDRLSRLQALDPQSDWAKAADYYLGLMGTQFTKASGISDADGRTHLWRYLKQAPTGRYSAYAADVLDRPNTPFNADEHTLLGLAFASNPEFSGKALPHLNQAPHAQIWLVMGKAKIEAGQSLQGVKDLLDGFSLAQTADEAKTALDLILGNTPPANRAPLLQHLGQGGSRYGDMALWALTGGGSTNDTTIYQQILQRFPHGDYAPESSWHLLWTLHTQAARFLEASRLHLSLYPKSRSVPRVLFWQGKVLEAAHRLPEAQQLYEDLTSRYPINYYAYRALNRLKVLAERQPDAKWQLAGPLVFPSSNPELPAPSDITELPERYYEAVQELLAIGATDDVVTLYERVKPGMPGDVKAWLGFLSGNPAYALKLLRSDLEQKQLEGLVPTDDALKLAYPIIYAETIAKQARAQGVDPYLVAAIIREESAYNPQAISTSHAYGLMQLLLPTAAEQMDGEDKPCSKLKLFNPVINIKVGARYVSWLLRYPKLRHDPMLAVASYNGGPGQVSGWLAKADPDADVFIENIPSDETRNYIKKVFSSYWTYIRLYGGA